MVLNLPMVESIWFLGVNIIHNLSRTKYIEDTANKAPQHLSYLRGLCSVCLQRFLPISRCITHWFGHCFAHTRKKLEWVVDGAQSIAQTILQLNCFRKAANQNKDNLHHTFPFHPSAIRQTVQKFENIYHQIHKQLLIHCYQTTEQSSIS